MVWVWKTPQNWMDLMHGFDGFDRFNRCHGWILRHGWMGWMGRDLFCLCYCSLHQMQCLSLSLYTIWSLYIYICLRIDCNAIHYVFNSRSLFLQMVAHDPQFKTREQCLLGKKNNLQHSFPKYWRFHLFTGILGGPDIIQSRQNFRSPRLKIEHF